jgi:hypothetical protein
VVKIKNPGKLHPFESWHCFLFSFCFLKRNKTVKVYNIHLTDAMGKRIKNNVIKAMTNSSSIIKKS